MLPALGETRSAINVVEKLDHAIVCRPLLDASARFEQPVWLGPVPGLDGTFLVLEHRTGKAWLLDGLPGEQPLGEESKSLFADWGEVVTDGPWEGLMCVAFHPDFEANRRFFIKHETMLAGRRHTVVMEKQASADGRADSGSVSTLLLAIPQPADNHNGGTLAFGPDGCLYIGMGDGGPQEDPHGYTQSGQSLLGKMLRIAVDDVPAGQRYRIPSDNPFIDQPDGVWRPEIWALGLREPWRFSFDRETDDLWVGDVGQLRYEEVLMLARGENHGWNVREGWEAFKESERRADEVYAEPMLAYGRHLGGSITGGYVYRGSRYAGWRGVYLFGDFNTRRLFGLRQEEGEVTAFLQIGEAPEAPASFGEGPDGELYLVGYQGGLFALELGEEAFPKRRPLVKALLSRTRRDVRHAAEQVMGAFPDEERRVPLGIETLQTVDMGSYVRKLITYQSEPKSRTPAYLCVPKANLPARGALCLHPTDMKVGHQVVVGLGGKSGRQYAAELAERGWVTVAPAYPLLANYWPNLSALGYESGTMKAIWDNSRALDLLAQLPEVDSKAGFGAIGHSLGGHNALFTALFDDRIRALAVSCSFDRFRDYYGGEQGNWYYGKGWCQWRYMPRLSNYRHRLHEIPFDFPDILTAIAPCPLFVNAPLRDANFDWESVKECVDMANVYDRRFGLGQRIVLRQPDTEHDFVTGMREEAYALLEAAIR